LCFERRHPKQNSVIRLKSNIFPPQIFGLAKLLWPAALAGVLRQNQVVFFFQEIWCLHKLLGHPLPSQPSRGYRVSPSFDLQRDAQSVFFFAETFRSFLLRHFGHWNISVICLTVVLKLTITVFFSLYFETFWPKWLNFFRSFQKRSGLWPKNNSAQWSVAVLYKGTLQGFGVEVCEIILTPTPTGFRLICKFVIQTKSVHRISNLSDTYCDYPVCVCVCWS